MREDAGIAAALETVCRTLADRHRDIVALEVAARMCRDASADLTHAADRLAAAAPAPGGLLDGE